MKSALQIIGSFFILLSIAFHLYAFFLESIAWLKPKAWKAFGLPSQEYAEIMRTMAFNQGFYNLFLALGSSVGLAVMGANSTIGLTLLCFSSLSMGGAGVVLFFSKKSSRRAALIQALPPLLGTLLLLVGRSL